jgi:hypothetical protein
MIAKKLTAGSEIDSWCTKCKLDLSHRIIAMVGDQPKRVECRTCKSHHNYYRPKALGAAAPAKADKKVATTRTATGKAPSSASARAVAAAKAENDRERGWEKTVSGHPPTAFKPYRVSSLFELGQLVHHPKFGDGYVQKVIDRHKMEVMFRDGVRTLAHGMEA